MHNQFLGRYIRWHLGLSGLMLVGGMTPTPTLAQPPTTTPTAAQTSMPTATPTATPVPDSSQNYEGDRVIFSQNVGVIVKDGVNPPRKSTLLHGTQLLGMGKAQDGKYSFVVSKCSPYLGFIGDLLGYEPDKEPCTSTPWVQGCVSCDALLEPKLGSTTKAEVLPILAGATVEVEESQMTGNGKPSRYGFAFGTLLAPFKFQLTGDHDLTGAATIGPFLGYRAQNQFYGLAVTPALFAGATNLSVSGKDGGTSQVLGFSYGGALLLDVKSAFQAGAILGWDRTGDSEGYEYNNKPWLGVQIGYSFTKTVE